MGGSSSAFENFAYSGWEHVTDAEFVNNMLTYNDETGTFLFSQGANENGEYTQVGESKQAMGDYGGVATIKTNRGEWWALASGRAELDNSLFDVITIGRGLASTLAKTVTKKITAKSVGAAAKGFSKNSFKAVDKKLLSKYGIEDIHAFKAEYIGKGANVSLYDVVKSTNSGELLIIRKATQQIVEYTGIFIK